MAIAVAPAPTSSLDTVTYQDHFRAADTNADGALSKPEVEAAQMRRVLNHFDLLDEDRDGKLTPGEIRALLPGRVST